MKKIFSKASGESFCADSLKLIQSKRFLSKYKGKFNLIFTSPPFPLISKKKYGNEFGDDYVSWLSKFSKPLSNLLSDDGSIIIELGNSWEKGQPTFSTTNLEALLEFKKSAGLHLCQEFICHNPSRLPNPAHWVTVKRVRVNDTYTRIWWLSKSPNPKADNRQVLTKYSSSMVYKLKKKNFNIGKRPSGYKITDNFDKNNKGSIPPNFINLFGGEFLFENLENSLSIPNSSNQSVYNQFCLDNELERHPARMQIKLCEFFIRFLTNENDTVFDPFAGSNTTGMVAEVLKRKWVSSEFNLDYIKGSLIRFFDEDKSKHIIKKLAKRSL
jgi:site-specific DNA-methyltransferase (cytosine-N4-specific)